MSIGYGPAIRVFTKIYQDPFSLLRNLGHRSVVYVEN